MACWFGYIHHATVHTHAIIAHNQPIHGSHQFCDRPRLKPINVANISRDKNLLKSPVRGHHLEQQQIERRKKYCQGNDGNERRQTDSLSMNGFKRRKIVCGLTTEPVTGNNVSSSNSSRPTCRPAGM